MFVLQALEEFQKNVICAVALAKNKNYTRVCVVYAIVKATLPGLLMVWEYAVAKRVDFHKKEPEADL